MMDNDTQCIDFGMSEDLITLISRGDTENVVRMLGTGLCDSNYVTEGGATALSTAAARNDHELMCVLINHGADVNSGPGLEYLQLIADMNKNDKMIDLLKKGQEKKDDLKDK
jgi:ankyrin repeat protein